MGDGATWSHSTLQFLASNTSMEPSHGNHSFFFVLTKLSDYLKVCLNLDFWGCRIKLWESCMDRES
jgi:hypothetical protein